MAKKVIYQADVTTLVWKGSWIKNKQTSFWQFVLQNFKVSMFCSPLGKVPGTSSKPFYRHFKYLTNWNLSLLQKLYFLGDKWRVSSPVESAAGARLISEAEKVVVPEPARQREKIILRLDFKRNINNFIYIYMTKTEVSLPCSKLMYVLGIEEQLNTSDIQPHKS